MFLRCVLKVLGGALSEESNKAAGKDAGARLKLRHNRCGNEDDQQSETESSQCLRSSVKKIRVVTRVCWHAMQKRFTAMQYWCPVRIV